MSARAIIAALLLALASPVGARPAVDAVQGLPPMQADDDRRCTDDGRDCIRKGSYVRDVCTLIERHAAINDLDPAFLARLLWKESRFEPGAISPVGAIGIAQFMPGTARLYDLHDPLNPAKAIAKSAWYLRRLTDQFGNIGLAAVAYNGGEARAARFVAGRTVLPYETQDYVQAITGHNAWGWRDNPPDAGAVDLALDGDTPFHAACVTMAGDRSLREFSTPQHMQPWGVIIGSHPSQSGAAAAANRLNRQLRPLLGERHVAYIRRPLRPGGPVVYTAQVGFGDRASAQKFCLRLRQVGGGCIVLRN